MANEMVVFQGKSFSVGLQSMLGSTAYGWCLTGLPKGVVLLNIETEKVQSPNTVAPIIQKFWFVAVSETDKKAEIEFTMMNFTNLSATDQKHNVSISVVPSDSSTNLVSVILYWSGCLASASTRNVERFSC